MKRPWKQDGYLAFWDCGSASLAALPYAAEDMARTEAENQSDAVCGVRCTVCVCAVRRALKAAPGPLVQILDACPTAHRCTLRPICPGTSPPRQVCVFVCMHAWLSYAFSEPTTRSAARWAVTSVGANGSSSHSVVQNRSDLLRHSRVASPSG